MNVWTVSFVVVELEAVSHSRYFIILFSCVCLCAYLCLFKFTFYVEDEDDHRIYSFLLFIYIVYLFVYVVRDAPSHSLKKAKTNIQ